eukprot:7362167-Alexandrium_andersonii.AAC.2
MPPLALPSLLTHAAPVDPCADVRALPQDAFERRHACSRCGAQSSRARMWWTTCVLQSRGCADWFAVAPWHGRPSCVGPHVAI